MGPFVGGTQVRTGQYLQAQVLIGLRAVWQELGFDPAAVSAERRIDEALRESGDWEEIDLADVFYRIERAFGFTASREEWGRWGGALPYVANHRQWDEQIAPHFTFGGLAEFIAQRAAAPLFEPMHVLGRPCESAGAFRLLQRKVADVSPCSPEFAPGSRLRDVLSTRQLRRIWWQLQMSACGRLAPLKPKPTSPFERLFAWLNRHAPNWWSPAALLISLSFLALALLGYTILLIAGFIAACVLTSLALWIVDECSSPLPDGVETFRDLSVALASARPQPRARLSDEIHADAELKDDVPL